MRDVIYLLFHLLTTLAKLIEPGGSRTVGISRDPVGRVSAGWAAPCSGKVISGNPRNTISSTP
jgi:hypothetical protein